jgi:hypothetical protein
MIDRLHQNGLSLAEIGRQSGVPRSTLSAVKIETQAPPSGWDNGIKLLDYWIKQTGENPPRVGDYYEIGCGLAVLMEEIEAELAKPKPFAPDWASYRQGHADGSCQQKPLTPQEVWALMPWNYDMESAPKDGSSILLKLETEIPSRGIYHTGSISSNGVSIIAGRFGFDCPNPIAWLPLPEQSK